MISHWGSVKQVSAFGLTSTVTLNCISSNTMWTLVVSSPVVATPKYSQCVHLQKLTADASQLPCICCLMLSRTIAALPKLPNMASSAPPRHRVDLLCPSRLPGRRAFPASCPPCRFMSQPRPGDGSRNHERTRHSDRGEGGGVMRAGLLIP